MAKTLGVTLVRLNGVDYRTKPGASIKLGGKQKTPQFASGKLSGFSEVPVACEFTGSFEVMSDTDIEAIRKFEGQADFVTDVGITYSSSNATITEPPELQEFLGFVIMGEAAVKV